MDMTETTIVLVAVFLGFFLPITLTYIYISKRDNEQPNLREVKE